MIAIDLSRCSQIPRELIIRVIEKDTRINKLVLNNIALHYDDIVEILITVNRTEKIFDLDLSNVSSQSMNRIGENHEFLFKFASENKIVNILKLSNLNLRKAGLSQLVRGIK